MAEHKSDQVTKIDASPSQILKANERGGRVRMDVFEFTVPAGNAAISDTVNLTAFIPKGARMLGGEIAFEAMTTGGGDASVQLGDGTTADKYLGTTSVDAAGRAAFGNTIALNFLEELTAPTRLVATVLTEAWAAGQKLKGYLLYVVD